MAEKLSLSHSKISTYRECPLKYKFHYIDKLPEAPKYFFALGTAMHSAMEYLYSAKKDAFPSLEETQNHFTKEWAANWGEKGYFTPFAELTAYTDGLKTIAAYYAKFCQKYEPIVSTEFKVTAEFDGISLIGIADRIDFAEGGKVVIVDYKTGKKVQRAPEQLMMYQKLMSGNKEILTMLQARRPEVKQVEVDHMLFLHLKEPDFEQQSFPPATEEEMKDFWARLLKTAGDIKAEQFEPDPGETKCRFCDYKKFCPVWKDSYGENATTEELSAEIDSYGKALRQTKKQEKNIISVMNKLGLTKCSATDFEAELTKIQTVDFKDKEKTVETLKSLKLLGKTLVPTLSSIKKLLDSPDVPAEQKQLLKDLATFGEEYKLSCTETDKW